LGPGSDTVGLVGCLGLLGGLVLGVEVVESLEEFVGETMLVINIKGTLSSLVANNVTVSKILGDDTGTWLLLLGDLICVLLGTMGLFKLLGTLCACNYDLGLSELCVVEQQSRLGGGLFLESYRSILSLSSRSNLNPPERPNMRE